MDPNKPVTNAERITIVALLGAIILLFSMAWYLALTWITW